MIKAVCTVNTFGTSGKVNADAGSIRIFFHDDCKNNKGATAQRSVIEVFEIVEVRRRVALRAFGRTCIGSGLVAEITLSGFVECCCGGDALDISRRERELMVIATKTTVRSIGSLRPSWIGAWIRVDGLTNQNGKCQNRSDTYPGYCRHYLLPRCNGIRFS